MPFHIRAIARPTEKSEEVLQARLLYWHYKETEKLATQDTARWWYFESTFTQFEHWSKIGFVYTEIKLMFMLIRFKYDGELQILLKRLVCTFEFDLGWFLLK